MTSTAPFNSPSEDYPQSYILASTLGYVWDVATLEWVKATQAGGGGGGAVTIADGADVALGAKADAAWVSGDGTAIAILKTIAAGGAGLTDAQLRATPVPISGTVTANTGLVQALTDTQLRATPVPVSGTVTANATGYVVRLDEASSTITYVGQAVPGTATSAASWSIKRLDSTSGLIVLWGAGTAAFNQIWDNRAALAYS